MELRRLLLPAAALALTACSYGAPDEVINGAIVFTQPLAADTEFAPLRTFYLDPVVTVNKDGQPQPDQSLDDAKNAPTRNAIITQMTTAGYTAAATSDLADVGLKVGVELGTVDYYYSGGWCDIYYGYYGCYYPPVYGGSYSFGMVILGMVDLRGAPPAGGQAFPGLWFSSMYGITSSYASTNQQKVVAAINRSFEQSPYLRTSAP